eukprot:TRINITY_DN5264_c0_g1_i2.p4 TRINITY_DN5264_c0_g1~~TRINITY_DN5264_c0_g1_i2.p4  ORF type:complete len:103 (+),score=29.65 TRINITY_DN5264_c0_g1_i2:329-637(+)
MSGCISHKAHEAPEQSTVLRERSARVLNADVTAMMVLTALAWTLYGLSQDNVKIWGPNAVGLALASVQAALVVLLGGRPPVPSPQGGAGGHKAEALSQAEEV